MKHIIIGTAGHIDHGKSTLIKAITNIEPDRLKEEKERGMTIELGFAYFDLPSGRRAGIVDVPGHERFIKNMLAGAGGMDIVILVIAANEGIMPQTLEHLHILSLLDTQKGIVAITKIDMVEPEWLELVLEDTREQLQGTFLEQAPIIPVSSTTRQGIPELVQTIDELTAEVVSRDENLPFRLPIDRVFSLTGFGTIVTGTLIAGQVQVGDRAEVFPQGVETRVRSVQVHNQQVDKAYAGQRVAMNLAGLQVSDLQRGDVLAAPGLLRPSLMLDVRLEMLSAVEQALENRDRLRLYIGTSEILCRAVLLDAAAVLPGEKALVQLRLEEPVAVQTGDRFVVRTYSPMYTIGGGVILDSHPKKRRRFRPESIRELELRESGGDLQILNQTLLQHSDKFPTEEELFSLAGRPAVQLQPAMGRLQEDDVAVSLVVDERTRYLHNDYLLQLAERAGQAVTDYHQRYPLRAGMPKEELRSRVAKQASPKLFNSLLTLLTAEADLVLSSGTVAAADFEVKFTGVYRQLRDQIMERLQAEPYAPPSLEELAAEQQTSLDRVSEVVVALEKLGQVVRVSHDLAFDASAVAQAQEEVVGTIREKEQISLADLRNQLGTSRKYALALLDYFDAQKITLRQGDVRVLHPRYQG